MINPRLFCPPQLRTHLSRHLTQTRRRTTQQLREQQPHQRRRDPRIFFPRWSTARVARTTTPTATASCDGANRSNSGPRSDSAPPLGCRPRTTLRPRGGHRGRRPPPPTVHPPWHCSACTTLGGRG